MEWILNIYDCTIYHYTQSEATLKQFCRSKLKINMLSFIVALGISITYISYKCFITTDGAEFSWSFCFTSHLIELDLRMTLTLPAHFAAHTDKVEYLTFNLKFKTLDFDVQLKTFSNLIIINIHGIFNNPDCENLRFESRAFFVQSSLKQFNQCLGFFGDSKNRRLCRCWCIADGIRNKTAFLTFSCIIRHNLNHTVEMWLENRSQ